MTTKWWRKTEPLYRRFAGFSFEPNEIEAQEMFNAETFGKRFPISPDNRYLAGKRFMDATVAMWREDIASGILTKAELLQDKSFLEVRWWLEGILKTIPPSTSMFFL